jgi:hypothetical protein
MLLQTLTSESQINLLLTFVTAIDPRVRSLWLMASPFLHASHDLRSGRSIWPATLSRRKKEESLTRGMLALAAIAAPLLLAACVTETPTSKPSPSAGIAPEPRYTSFNCEGKSELTLEDFDTSVHVIDSRGVDVVLPASPPAQTSRYGQPGYALILEGGKALWMVGGKPPVNCRRQSAS